MRFLKRAAVFLGLLILLVMLMNFVVMPWYVRHNTLVQVPDVRGLSFEDAKKKLDEAGLEGLQGDIRYDPSKSIGTVIDQLPPSGQIVKDSRRIYLIISGGEQLHDVPNLVGRSLREAKFILSQRNLGAQEVEYKPSMQYPAGIVLSQLEQPGMKVKKGTLIGLIVSAGMSEGDIRVPDLSGKNIEEAKKILLQSKLSIGKISYQPSQIVPLNSVIDQYPKANTMAKENQKVDLFVNREQKKKIIIEGEEDGIIEKEVPMDNLNEDTELKPKQKDDKSKQKEDQIKSVPDKEKKDEKKSNPPKEKERKDNKKTTDGGTNF